MDILKFEGDAVAAIEHLGKFIDGFKSVLLLRSAVKMNLFDTIENYGSNGVSAVQLEKDKSMNQDKIERVMNALVAVGALSKSYKDTGVGLYQNTAMGRLLTEEGGFKEYVDSTLDEATGFEKIATGITKDYDAGMGCMHTATEHHDDGEHEGETDSKGTHGHHEGHEHHGKKQDEHHHGDDHHHHGDDHHHHSDQGSDDHHHHTESDADSMYKGYLLFDVWGKAYAKQLVAAMELEGCTALVDLGGGSGMFSFEAARMHPSLTATLMDVPVVIDCVKKYFLPKDEQLKVNMIPGDFLKKEIPPADVYLLSNVIHDWTEKFIIKLVEKISSVAKPGARIIILEKCFTEDKTGPLSASMWDMFMLPYPPCRGRSLAEYQAIMANTHFSTVRAKYSNPECTYDMIIASN